MNGSRYEEILNAAQVLGLQVQSWPLREPGDLDRTFEAAARERAEAFLVLTGPLPVVLRPQIVKRVGESGLPAVYEARDWAIEGGLMAYGPSLTAQSRRAAYYVDRILKGAKPADLPVEQPMTFDFVVNMKTARELGITFPNEIMLQVTEVVQ
jgi:putative ABC transport system substrate-binding protein